MWNKPELNLQIDAQPYQIQSRQTDPQPIYIRMSEDIQLLFQATDFGVFCSLVLLCQQLADIVFVF